MVYQSPQSNLGAPAGVQGGSGLLFRPFDEWQVDIRRLFMMFIRRRLVFLSIVLIVISLTVLALQFVPSYYSGRSLVMIEGGQARQKPLDLPAFMMNIRVDTTMILSEIEVIKSRTLARRVVDRLNLMADSDFNNAVPSRNGTEAEQPAAADYKALSLSDKDLSGSASRALEGDINRVTDSLLRNLEVRAVPGSYVIQIVFSAKSPQKAARIANAFADVYIEQRLDSKFKSTEKLTTWLDQRLHTLREQLRSSEAAVEDYKAENNITVGARAELTAQELSELNSQLVLAKAKEAEAQAKLDQIKSWISDPAKIELSSEVLNADLVLSIKRVEADIIRRRGELSERYGPKHPAMVNLEAELREVRTKIDEEMRKVARTLENNLGVEQARVASLEENLGIVEGQKKTENQATIKLRELEREAESNRLLFNKFLETYKRSDKQDELQEPDARILSYASIPHHPSFPNRPLIVFLAFTASLFMGVLVVMVLEKMDNAFRSATQLETALHFPCYGLVPAIRGLNDKDLADYPLNKPASALAESVRALRAVLPLRKPADKPAPRVVAFTSSLPGEGKSTLSVWMGRLAAKAGEKVIIIDADLRRPRINGIVGKKPERTIVEFLSGQARIDEVVDRSDKSGVHTIYARSVPNSAMDLISSEAMRMLIGSLRQVYDLIIIDTPAALAVSDARMLATYADHTFYLVGWNKTPREIVTMGVKQFADIGYRPLSFVLSNVDVSRHVRYGYGDTAYYYGKFKEYYSN
ncbi:MAG: AAA family ATPase [Alphaproteobacteria bacterium]|nr:AAA family ATPase [Alphaproteobacteria bacterium]